MSYRAEKLVIDARTDVKLQNLSWYKTGFIEATKLHLSQKYTLLFVVFCWVRFRFIFHCSFMHSIGVHSWAASFVLEQSYSDTLCQCGHPELCGHNRLLSWWRPQMEAFPALLAFCAGNSPVSGEFPGQRPVTRSFDIFFDLCPKKRLSKQWRRWWFETQFCSLRRHCNGMITKKRD